MCDKSENYAYNYRDQRWEIAPEGVALITIDGQVIYEKDLRDD